jgi:hypothetical protein
MKTNTTSTIRTGTSAKALAGQSSAPKHGAARRSAGCLNSLPSMYLGDGFFQTISSKPEGVLLGVGRDNQD